MATKPVVVIPTLPPKTLTLTGVVAYLSLGSPQAADRWLRAHGVLMFKDRLGYVRAFVKDIDAANFKLAAEALEAPRRLAEQDEDERRVSGR
jgi:hypothetical protein